VVPGKPQIASLAKSLPMENSPPGIHTIPSGAGPGGDDSEETGAAAMLAVSANVAARRRFLTFALMISRSDFHEFSFW
jgi:hypothetical protein